MNEQNQRDSIMSMARGAFEERVDYEMDKVIQNILFASIVLSSLK